MRRFGFLQSLVELFPGLCCEGIIRMRVLHNCLFIMRMSCGVRSYVPDWCEGLAMTTLARVIKKWKYL